MCGSIPSHISVFVKKKTRLRNLFSKQKSRRNLSLRQHWGRKICFASRAYFERNLCFHCFSLYVAFLISLGRRLEIYANKTKSLLRAFSEGFFYGYRQNFGKIMTKQFYWLYELLLRHQTEHDFQLN